MGRECVASCAAGSRKAFKEQAGKGKKQREKREKEDKREKSSEFHDFFSSSIIDI